MKNLSAKDVAQMIAGGGRKCYEDDGVVTPTMFLVGSNLSGIILHPSPELGDHPPEAYAEVVFRVGKLFPWRIIGTSSEVWTRAFAPDEDTSRHRRGDLEKMEAAGDVNVRTAVVGQAIDLRLHDASYTEISTADVTPSGIEWDTFGFPGIPEGDMTAMILNAYSQSIEPDVPKGVGLPPLSLLCDVLVEAKVASVAMLLDGPRE